MKVLILTYLSKIRDLNKAKYSLKQTFGYMYQGVPELIPYALSPALFASIFALNI